MAAETQVYTAPDYVGASCSSPQDCTVAYAKSGAGGAGQVFSVTRQDGTWSAEQVPGLSALGSTDAAVPAAKSRS